MPLHDPDTLHRALRSRDARFDGVFFVGITSTRIYCRPICPAPPARREHCRFFGSAAAAERRGFRPCLRCRPELAPGNAATVASVDAVERLATLAASRIAAGALDRGGLELLAAELDVSARHLRRAVERTLGVTPVALAQTRRLLVAKQLLTETTLPVTQVAMASGFRSVRRFNALFQEQYRLAPGALRRAAVPVVRSGGGSPRAARAASSGRDAAATTAAEGTVSLALHYRPPFDWRGLLAHLTARATPGVEVVSAARGGSYGRTVRLHGHVGTIVVTVQPPRRTRTRPSHALRVELSASLLPVLVPLLSRLRRLLDLDADPAVVAAHFEPDAMLGPLVRRRPGLRAPGALDGVELALRAVLGQQVSVRGATTLAGRLARLVSEPFDVGAGDGSDTGLTLLPFDAGRLADASQSSVAAIGIPGTRAATLLAVAGAAAGGELPELTADVPRPDPAGLVRRLTALPGIGPWTAQYVAMRVLRWPDAFLDGDLALRRAMGGLTPGRMRATAEPWRPWRSYAVHHLWASLNDDGA